MSFVRNLFFSVFLGVWGTLSAQEERVIPVPREVLPGTGEFRMSEVTAWHTNLSGAEKESLVITRQRSYLRGDKNGTEKIIRARMSYFFKKYPMRAFIPKGMFWKLNRK